MRSRAPIPNSETVKGNDVVQAVPTGTSLSDAEVATTPQGTGTSRREFAQAPAVVLAAADIAAAVAAAPGLAERVHLSRVLQRRRKDGGVRWGGGTEGESVTHNFCACCENRRPCSAKKILGGHPGRRPVRGGVAALRARWRPALSSKARAPVSGRRAPYHPEELSDGATWAGAPPPQRRPQLRKRGGGMAPPQAAPQLCTSQVVPWVPRGGPCRGTRNTCRP